MTFAVRDKVGAVLSVGLLGVAAVAPLQLRVLETAGEAGRNLAASLNIAAFNLRNRDPLQPRARAPRRARPDARQNLTTERSVLG